MSGSSVDSNGGGEGPLSNKFDPLSQFPSLAELSLEDLERQIAESVAERQRLRQKLKKHEHQNYCVLSRLGESFMGLIPT